MKQQGLHMLGNSMFRNPKFPGVTIGLTQMEMGNVPDGRKFLVNVTVMTIKDAPKKIIPVPRSETR